jgi:hypothetical protein
MTEAHKRALIVAYYLSRFDRKGVRSLGYTTFEQAYNQIGEVLSVKPATIKNMRDSFDPYCSQVRVGWYQRPILRSRANVIQAYDELSEAAMAEIVRALLNGGAEGVEQYTAPVSGEETGLELSLDDDNAFTTRLRTGETAETFFMEQFPTLGMFQGSTLEDTRKLGIGFDFRASFSQSYQAIEVKGVREAHGYISFTDKEWSVAQLLNDNYILALVRSLDDKPTLDLMPNPVQHISVKMRTIESVSVYWNARV